jgi:hypothetical protein
MLDWYIPFEIWISILKSREFMEVIAIIEEVVLGYVECISVAVKGTNDILF